MSTVVNDQVQLVDLRDRALRAWWRLRCALGLHAAPIGLIAWLRPYNPDVSELHYRNYLGCPHCRREVRK